MRKKRRGRAVKKINQGPCMEALSTLCRVVYLGGPQTSLN